MKLLRDVLKNVYPFGFKYDFRILSKNAIPLVLTNLNTFIFPVISLIFCGHIGTDELAAVSLAVTLMNVFGIFTINGLTSACDTIFPQLYGSHNKKELGIALQKSLLITTITSFPFIGLLLNAKNFMILLKQKREIILILDKFVIIYAPSIFFYGISVVLSRYAQCQNRVYSILFIYFIVNAINAGLHGLFIYYFHMGVNGAAVANTISNVILPILIFCYIFLSGLFRETWTGWSWKLLNNWSGYLKLSIPGLLMLLIEWVAYEIGTLLCSFLETVDLNAQSIVQQILVFAYMIPYSIGQSGNIHIGHLLGSNKPQEAKNAYKVVLTMSGFSILLNVIIIFATRRFLPLAFTTDGEVTRLASNVLYLIAALHIFDGYQGMLSCILKTVGSQWYGSIVCFIAFYVIGLPIGLSLMLKTKLRVYGFWIGMIIGIFVLAILQIIYTCKMNWRTKSYKATPKENKIEQTQQTKALNEDTYKIPDEIHDKSKPNKICLAIKRLILILVIISLSFSLIFTRNLLPLPESDSNLNITLSNFSYHTF